MSTYWTLNTILSILDWQEELGTKTSLLQDVTREGNIDGHIAHSQKEREKGLKRNKHTCVVHTWAPMWSSGDTPCVTTNCRQSRDTWIATVGIQRDRGSLAHSANRRCSGVNKRMTQNTPKIHTGHVTQYSECEPPTMPVVVRSLEQWYGQMGLHEVSTSWQQSH